ncbi:uncharacterized protein LOC113999848 [Pipra filicauda]|uniref:Uncharacterized protein LOC113999848 n=1 Tax=Pipra filicauda TaxID=649802 RepID=A0A7R5L3H8_9PASS|nr:uncharacterized protein LOC113999848 [Pipra filicauda]
MALFVIEGLECMELTVGNGTVESLRTGKKEYPGNYGPISLTSVPVKIMENIILGGTEKCLEDNTVIGHGQHDSMSGKSFLSNLISSYDKQGAGWVQLLQPPGPGRAHRRECAREEGPASLAWEKRSLQDFQEGAEAQKIGECSAGCNVGPSCQKKSSKQVHQSSAGFTTKIHQNCLCYSLPFLTWASWQKTIKREKLIRILLTLLKHGGYACVTGTATSNNILNNDTSMTQRDLDNFVNQIHLRSMSKCRSQAYLAMKNGGHTCGMRECVFETGTLLKINPLKRHLEKKIAAGHNNNPRISKQ